MDPNKFNFQIRTEDGASVIPIDNQNIFKSDFQGLTPIIIDIIPIPMPLFLSEFKTLENQEEPQIITQLSTL